MAYHIPAHQHVVLDEADHGALAGPLSTNAAYSAIRT